MRLSVNYITEFGSSIYGEITVSKDYTMNEVVSTLKNRGAVMFRLTDTMKTFAKIN